MQELRVAAIVTVLSFLTACGHLPAPTPEIPYDRASAPSIRTIGLVTPGIGDPDLIAPIAGRMLGVFGALGGLASAGITESRNTTVIQTITKGGFSAGDLFQDKLVAGLKAEGYQIVPLAIQRDHKKFLDNFDKVPTATVDAYLDIAVLTYGYLGNDDTPYHPYLVLDARLVRASDKTVLMTDHVAYGTKVGVSGVIALPADPNYQFKDLDALVGQSDSAGVGLKTAVEQSAQAVYTLLR